MLRKNETDDIDFTLGLRTHSRILPLSAGAVEPSRVSAAEEHLGSSQPELENYKPSCLEAASSACYAQPLVLASIYSPFHAGLVR